MRPSTRATVPGIVLLGLLLWPLGGGAQDPEVYREVKPERLEKILAGLNIKYEKKDGTKPGVVYYDFKRGDQKVRLHNYNGADLWIDSLFNDKATLATVNGWNVKAKFSRAVLLKDGEVSLENQIDCLGGVTDAIIRQFISRFDGEIKGFTAHLSK